MNQFLTVNQQPWLHFKRPFVRDLAFAIACPDALKYWINPQPNTPAPVIEIHKDSFWQQHYQNYESRLHELDNTKQYKKLTKYLMSRPSPYRLGFHFEGLLHFWLEDGYQLNAHPYEVLAHNIQLYRDKQTTGELDFILKNHASDCIEHWELAVKFYLGSPPYDFENWVGINSRDNLQRKMTHMQTKQFRTIWVDLDCYDKVKIDKRYVVLKGRFFKPQGLKGSAKFIKPEWLNDRFPMHKWHYIESNDDFINLNMPDLRPTQYIEWFTERPFYNTNYLNKRKFKSLKSSKISADVLKKNKHHYLNHWPYTSLKFDDLDTNLYMNNSEPVVLVVNKADDDLC